jgi:2-hydroxychromene-2-carboxylate isomerase
VIVVAKPSNSLQLELFFDYSCPWAYLAFVRARETAMRTGAHILWKPVLLGRVLETVNPALLETGSDPKPLHALYQAKDLADWARFCGLKIVRPYHWPDDVELALRGAIVASEYDAIDSFSRRVFEAYFGEQQDINQVQVLVEIAVACGLNKNRFQQRIVEADTLVQVQRNTDELLERGGFGCPTMFVGNDMYFGNDRLPLVEMALGQASGFRFVMPGQHG